MATPPSRSGPPEANHESGEREPAGEQTKYAGQETDDKAHERKHLELIQARRYQHQWAFAGCRWHSGNSDHRRPNSFSMSVSFNST
jgi:hypothetical protein